MADGFAFAEFVEVRLDVAGGDGEVFVEEAEEVGFGWVGDWRLRQCRPGGEEFDAVAGGEDEALADAGLVEEGAGGVGEAGGGDGEALANFDGRGVVVDASRTSGPGCLWRRIGIRTGVRMKLGLELVRFMGR